MSDDGMAEPFGDGYKEDVARMIHARGDFKTYTVGFCSRTGRCGNAEKEGSQGCDGCLHFSNFVDKDRLRTTQRDE